MPAVAVCSSAPQAQKFWRPARQNPAAYFFYVNKNNTKLAADISLGLEKALKDGSFERIFNKYFGSAIKEVQQEKRRVFSLTNPFLPSQVPLSRSELWLDLH